MADAEISKLDIQIQANADKAVRALNSLNQSMSNLNSAFSKLNTSGLRKFSKEIGTFTYSAKQLNNLKINIPKFNSKSIDALSNNVSKFNSIDTSNISRNATELNKIVTSINGLSNVKIPDNSLNKLVNALNRLAQVDMSNFDSSKIREVTDSISTLSGMPDISQNISRVISAIAKLGGVGNTLRATTTHLPSFTSAVVNMTHSLKGAGNVSKSTSQLVTSIAQLANAGSKTGATASGLGTLSQETLKFINAMKGAPRVSGNTVKLVQALGQLASAGRRATTANVNISKSFNSLGNVFNKVASIAKSTVGTITSAFKRIGDSSSHVNKARSNLAELAKGFLLFRGVSALVDFTKTSVELGSSITEVENVVDVSFGSMAQKAYDFANIASEQFGLSELAAKQYAGTMMAMLKSSGIAVGAASDMSIALSGLAGDFASFYNIASDEAFTKIRSGIAGEVEPLRQLGISMTVANLEAYALSQGITKSYQAMTQAEKVMLRYNYLMSVSTDQQGDFQRTADSYANSVRRLALNFQTLQSVVGQGLIAALLPVVQVLNAIITRLIQAAKVFKSFMYTLFGYKGQGSQSGIASETVAVEGLGDAGQQASGGLDDATSSAKKLKKALSVLPFDELNQLVDNSQKDISGGSGTGVGDIDTGIGGLGDISSELDEILKKEETVLNEWARRLQQAFKANDWKRLGFEIANGLNKGLAKVYDVLDWNKVKKKILPFINGFTETFNSLVQYFDWATLGRTIGAGVNTLVNTLDGFITRINWGALGSKISLGFNSLVNEVNWGKLGELFADKFMIAWNFLYNFIAGLDFMQIGVSVGDFINEAFKKIDFGKIGNTLSNGLNGVFDLIYGITDTIRWEDVRDNIVEGFNNFFIKFKWKENAQKLDTFLKDLGDTLVEATGKIDWEAFGASIGKFLSEIDWYTHLKNVANVLVNALGGLLKGLASTPAGVFVVALGSALTGFKLLGTVYNFANKFIKILTGNTVVTLLKNAITSKWGSAISDGLTNTLPKATTATNTLTGSLGSLIAKIGEASLGTVAAGNMFAHFNDILDFNKASSDNATNGIHALVEELGMASGATQTQISIWKAFTDQNNSSQESIGKLLEDFKAYGVTADQVVTAIKKLNSEQKMSKKSSEILSQALSSVYGVTIDFANGMDEAEKSTTKALNTMSEKSSKTLPGIKTDAEDSFDGVSSTTEDNWGVALTTVVETLKSMKGESSKAMRQVFKNVESYTRSIQNISTLAWNNIATNISNAFEDMLEASQNSVTNIVNSFNGLSGKISNAIGNLYNIGRNLGISLANGFASVRIPTPHLYIASYSQNKIGNTQYSVPNYGVRWYAKGGLFDQASVIGVGEAGREAVLPLENRKTMSMIADSITSRMSNTTNMSADIKQAVMEGIATVMMNNSQNQPPIIVNAELRTENNEVLARAVARGNRSLDYRYNR